MGDLELFVKSGELFKLYSPSISYKKRGKVFFFSHAVKDYCAGAIRICKGFFCRLWRDKRKAGLQCLDKMTIKNTS